MQRASLVVGIAARVYAAKHKMAQEAQDACTKIVVLAERRIGLELIEAQKRGELAQPNQPHVFRYDSEAKASGECLERPARLSEIGINKNEAVRFRAMAELDEADVEEVAANARERGSPVRKADFKRKAAAKRSPPVSVIPPKPPHLTQFSLWLRTGARCSDASAAPLPAG